MTPEQIKSLIRAGDHIDLEVHAVDVAIYQVFAHSDEQLTPVLNSSGQSLTFPSRYAALQALAELGVDSVEFVHRSAYGEMIGMETSEDQSEMRQPVRIAHLRSK